MQYNILSLIEAPALIEAPPHFVKEKINKLYFLKWSCSRQIYKISHFHLPKLISLTHNKWYDVWIDLILITNFTVLVAPRVNNGSCAHARKSLHGRTIWSDRT